MTAEEYFGDWIKVIDKGELFKIMRWLKTVNPDDLCPHPHNIFKAFRVCPYNECKVVFRKLKGNPRGVFISVFKGNKGGCYRLYHST